MDDKSQETDTPDNLDNLSVEELQELRRKVDRAIQSFENRRRKAALVALEETARAHGVKLSELLGGAGKSKARSTRTPGAAAYADPDDPSRTWSGRGRRPAWVKDALAQGRTLDELAI